jgi:hypothetical protein
VLNLSASGSAADTFHQRFLDESFPCELSRKAFAAFKRGAYDRSAVNVGRRTWQHRALDEYRSQVAFTELLMLLTDLGFAFDILGTCVRVVRDEARHVELCRRMVAALGGPQIIQGDPSWVRADASQPKMHQVLRIVVGSLCVGETLSMRLLAAATRYTADPLAKAVNACFVKDESIHSRFGWTLLEALEPTLRNADRREIAQTLPHFLEGAEGIVRSGPSDPEAAGNPFGYLPDEVRDRVFFQALERDILAPFEGLGISARRAWARRHEA